MSDEQFRAIATAMLDRRIRNLRWVDKKTWIDTSLISHAEYQLFLNARYAQGKFHQPDHWQEQNFPDGEAQAPVVGVRPSDTRAFCEWLSEQGWGRFRIPDEKETHKMKDALPGFWQGIHKAEGATQYKGLIPSFDRAVVRDRDLNFALNLDHVLDLARRLDMERVRTYAQSRAKTLKIDRSRDITRASARAGTHARGLANDLNIDHARGFAIAGDLVLALDAAPDLAQYIAQSLTRTSEATLANSLEKVLTQVLELERAITHARTYDYVFNRDLNLNELKQTLENIIANLTILSLRRKGLLPAFEGILIVREEL